MDGLIICVRGQVYNKAFMYSQDESCKLNNLNFFDYISSARLLPTRRKNYKTLPSTESLITSLTVSGSSTNLSNSRQIIHTDLTDLTDLVIPREYPIDGQDLCESFSPSLEERQRVGKHRLGMRLRVGKHRLGMMGQE